MKKQNTVINQGFNGEGDIIVERIKDFLRSIICKKLDYYNNYTFEYSKAYMKAASDILEKIEELENT